MKFEQETIENHRKKKKNQPEARAITIDERNCFFSLFSFFFFLYAGACICVTGGYDNIFVP